MGIEQRVYPRLEQEFPAYFDIVPDSTAKPMPKPARKGVVKNISGGGIYLVSSQMNRCAVKKLLSHSFKLNIEFYLPDFQSRINVLGEIRWIKDRIQWWNIFPKIWKMGIQFIYIEPSDKNSIIKYVINKQIENQLAKK